MNDIRLAKAGLLAAGVLLNGAGLSALIIDARFEAPRLGIVTGLALLTLAVVAQCATWRRLARSLRTALAATLGSYLGGAVLFALVIVGTHLVTQAQCGPSSGSFCELLTALPFLFLGPGACLILAGLASIAVLQRRRGQVSSPS